jgi:chromosomal replication initiator protein
MSDEIKRIQEIVAYYFKIPVEKITLQDRHRKYAYPRMIAVYLARRSSKLSYNQLSLHFGNRHHTTLMHAVEQMESSVLMRGHIVELWKLIAKNPKE